MLCSARGLARSLTYLPILIALCLTVSVSADPVETVVMLKDGKQMRGTLVSRDTETIKLNVDGEEQSIAVSDVSQVKTLDTINAQYQDRRAQLADDDLQGRYDLAYWLFEKKEYGLAMTELVDLRRRFPDDQKVPLLIKVIQQRMKLQADDDQGDDSTKADTTGTGEKPDGPAKPGEVRLLTDAEINTIKVWELPLNFAESRPTIIVPRDVIREALVRYADNPRTPKGTQDQQKLLRAPGYVQLQFLFNLRAREYYKDVIVREEPRSLLMFRQRVNPQYVVPYFRRYFGQGQIPGLVLLNGRSDKDAYTNFYMLQDFFYQDRRMIDRLQPEKSLLLQWGLERDLADFPAPDVPGWQPRFRSKDDPNYKRYVNWIESLTHDADYGIPQIVPTQAGDTTPKETNASN